MRVPAVLRAVPAAFVLLLGPAASAETFCLTVGVLPGDPSGILLTPCAGPPVRQECRLVTVPADEPLLYVGICAPEPSSGSHTPV